MVPRLVILGSASAVYDAEHDNSHMLLEGDSGAILIDCSGRPLVNLKQVGVKMNDLSDLILTHFHPDHISAVPNMLMGMWLTGRVMPVRIYGLHHCLERFEELMAAFQWEEWPGFYPVTFHHLPEHEGITVLDNEDFVITAAPVRHYVPTMGLRITAKKTGFVVAYSCDTVPCPEVVRLADGADLLIHEAAGDEPLGHSSAAQAGTIATEGNARKLGLIHYNVWETNANHLIPEAQSTFKGPVFLCEDMMEIRLDKDAE
jgi:ribonuclease Z